jgi:ribonuclease D
MLEYARLDSHYLIPMAEILQKELHERGRWELAREDFERLTQNIEDTTESSGDDFWKLHGARDLSPKQAAVLKSVYQYRESQAEKQDRPPFKVLSHQVLVNIAQQLPENLQSLADTSSLNQRLVRRYGKGLIQAIREGEKAPLEFRPRNGRPEEAVLNRINLLREWRKQAGQDMGVPSDVVLPKDVLNRIAWGNPQNKNELKKHMQDVPYRYERFGDEILNNLL